MEVTGNVVEEVGWRRGVDTAGCSGGRPGVCGGR